MNSKVNLQHRRRFLSCAVSLSVLGAFAAPGTPGSARVALAAEPSDLGTLLASPLRTGDDRMADAVRKPIELLRFAQVKAGMTVLDLSAGGGYTTQVLALAIGSRGKVWAQVEQLRGGLEQRIAQRPQRNIEVLVRPFDDPFPADVPRVDLVTLVQSYHDIVNTPTDRAKMNRGMFAALKPGGRLVVTDHAGRTGTGLKETQTLHRIEEQVLRREIEAAGFVFEAESQAWRNPEDQRDRPFFEIKVPSDRFALRFIRP